MNLIDVRIGSEYVHEDYGHCLVIGIHPQDPSSWVIQVFENEFEEEERFDITESKFLRQMKTN